MSDHKIILDEHHALDLLIRDLRVVCSWDVELFRPQPVRAKLAKDLRDFRNELRKHFATEESGSYLQEIGSRKPSAGVALIQLHQEHISFLEQLAALEKHCLEHEVVVVPATSLTIELHELLDKLKAHEQKETALLKEAFAV